MISDGGEIRPVWGYSNFTIVDIGHFNVLNTTKNYKIVQPAATKHL